MRHDSWLNGRLDNEDPMCEVRWLSIDPNSCTDCLGDRYVERAAVCRVVVVANCKCVCVW